jgi:hypothetical protein
VSLTYVTRHVLLPCAATSENPHTKRETTMQIHASRTRYDDGERLTHARIRGLAAATPTAYMPTDEPESAARRTLAVPRPSVAA